MYEKYIILLLIFFISNSWILDTTCGTHICKSLLGLQKIRVLKKDDFELYARGESIQAKAVETCLLKLFSRKILGLENYYYILKIIRNIISVLLLLQCGYEIERKGKSYSISFSNEYICDGIIDIDLLVLSLNDNIFHIDERKK